MLHSLEILYRSFHSHFDNLVTTNDEDSHQNLKPKVPSNLWRRLRDSLAQTAGLPASWKENEANSGWVKEITSVLISDN